MEHLIFGVRLIVTRSTRKSNFYPLDRLDGLRSSNFNQCGIPQTVLMVKQISKMQTHAKGV